METEHKHLFEKTLLAKDVMYLGTAEEYIIVYKQCECGRVNKETYPVLER